MIHVSNSSILMSVITTSILLSLICLFLNAKDFAFRMGYRLLAVLIVIAVARMIILFEMPRTVAIPYPVGLSKFLVFLQKPIVNSSISVTDLLVSIWIGVFLIRIVELKKSQVRFYNLVLQFGKELTDEAFYHDITDAISERLQMRNDFHIMGVPAIHSPMIFQMRREKYILLPAGVSFSSKEMGFVLTHEMMHYAKHDLLKKKWILLLCELYWWNPLMRILKDMTGILLETHIDVDLMRGINKADRVAYISCIQTLSTNANKQNSYPALAFCYGSIPVLKARLQFLKATQEVKKRVSLQKIVLPVIVATLFFASLLCIFEPYYVDPQTEETTVELTPDNSYIVLNDDGSYDIYYKGKYYASITQLNEYFETFPHRGQTQ